MNLRGYSKTLIRMRHLVRAANIIEASISKFRRLLPQGRRPFPESAQARLQGGVLGVHRLIF